MFFFQESIKPKTLKLPSKKQMDEFRLVRIMIIVMEE